VQYRDKEIVKHKSCIIHLIQKVLLLAFSTHNLQLFLLRPSTSHEDQAQTKRRSFIIETLDRSSLLCFIVNVYKSFPNCFIKATTVAIIAIFTRTYTKLSFSVPEVLRLISNTLARSSYIRLNFTLAPYV